MLLAPASCKVDYPQPVDEPGDFLRRVGGVSTFQWNPLRPIPGRDELVTVNNVGDLLGPLVVELMLQHLDPDARVEETPDRTVFSVGSVMHFAGRGDVIWGTGINGKVSNDTIRRDQGLDVRAVRGPWSAAFLTARGCTVPRVYGDPALLLPRLMPELQSWARTTRRDVLVAPNFNDLGTMETGDHAVLIPTDPLRTVLRTIAQSGFVVGSSLHAIVVADSLGIPARLVASPSEDLFKYRDYLGGTGRSLTRVAASVEEALALGPHEPADVDLDLLQATFPLDVWNLGPRQRTYRGAEIATAEFSTALLDAWLTSVTPEADHTAIERAFVDERLPAVLRAAADPEHAAEAVDEAATYRELVLPALDPGILPPELAEALTLLDDRDVTRLRLAHHLHGAPEVAELRAARPTSRGAVLALSIRLSRVRGGVERAELELVGVQTGDVRTVRLDTFPLHAAQWLLELDVVVDVAPQAEPQQVFVRLSDADGNDRRIAVGAPGTIGLRLDLDRQEAQTPPEHVGPWVLDPAVLSTDTAA